jgi:L-ribulose-5-phosphate 4-epimerase
MLEDLRIAVCDANRALVAQGLVTLTWGNVSGICPERRHVAIKPSGVAYEQLSPHDIVIVDLEGNVVDGELRPSSDTATHVALYRHFEHVRGITHTHSRHATAFAQARREIPCLGTTHADHFHGAVPVTRVLRPDEVQDGYEANTGAVIIERFETLDARLMPAVLVAGHAPFTWGASVQESLANAAALEAVAAMALDTLAIDAGAPRLEEHISSKHYRRKHGEGAYYGQE